MEIKQIKSANISMTIPLTTEDARFFSALAHSTKNVSRAFATYTKHFDKPLTFEQEAELKELAAQGKISYEVKQTITPYKCEVTISFPVEI